MRHSVRLGGNEIAENNKTSIQEMTCDEDGGGRQSDM